MCSIGSNTWKSDFVEIFMPEDTSQSTQNEGTPTSVMLHIDASGKERDVSFLSTSSTANNGLHPFAYSIELEEQASLLAAAGIAVSATANSTTPVSTIHELRVPTLGTFVIIYTKGNWDKQVCRAKRS